MHSGINPWKFVAIVSVAVLFALGTSSSLAVSFHSSASSSAASCDYKHGSEPSYANGKLYCMLAAHVIDNPSPNLLASSEELYLAAYMPLPSGCDTNNPSTCLPESLPSGTVPNCNPCFHGGALNNFPYHDHVLAGAPGFGKNGTAGTFKGPWVVIILVYNPAVSNSLGFTPLKSAAAIDTGEASGMFLQINPGASNPYEINTGVVL
ncbi:MAG: hypothetical protein ACHQ1H_06420, partial [Nitrososphaerales archaeon]